MLGLLLCELQNMYVAVRTPCYCMWASVVDF